MSSSAVALSEIVDAAVAEHRNGLGPLMPVLHSVQEKLGFIPAESIPMIAGQLNLSRAEIQGVIGFYHDFKTEPGGEHLVQLCRAEACQAMGSRELEMHVKQRLGIDFGQTSGDGLFSLEPVYCLGNCACAPSMMIDESLHARVSADRFDELVTGLEADE